MVCRTPELPRFISRKTPCFSRRNNGSRGILYFQPFYDPGDLEEIWEVNELFDRLLPLRGEILNGDLRPLYLAHLALATDGNHDPEEQKDAPVPAGLDKLTKAQLALADCTSSARICLPPLPRTARRCPRGSMPRISTRPGSEPAGSQQECVALSVAGRSRHGGEEGDPREVPEESEYSSMADRPGGPDHRRTGCGGRSHCEPEEPQEDRAGRAPAGSETGENRRRSPANAPCDGETRQGALRRGLPPDRRDAGRAPRGISGSDQSQLPEQHRTS